MSEDQAASSPSPPVAKQVDHTLADGRTDEYYWVRDDTRSDPEMLALLADENAYTKASLASTETLQDTLFDEISERITADDSTVPVKRGAFLYHREYRSGGEYPIYVRAPVANPEETQVLLNANELSKGHDYYTVGNWAVAPDDDLLAWAEDVVSRREYTIRFKQLGSGDELSDRIEKVAPSLAWSADSKHVFYIAKDPQTLLPYQVKRHQLGSPVTDDAIVYTETDDAYYTYLYTVRSREYVAVVASATDSTEVHLIDTRNPTAPARVFLPREDKHEYRVRHVPGAFYVLTNWDAPNFRVMKVAEDSTADKATWEEVVAHRAEVLIEDVEVFDDQLVVLEREQGLQRIRVISFADGTSRDIRFPDPAYTISLASNPEADSPHLRYEYSSLTRPDSVFDYSFETGESTLRKQQAVLGGFDRDNYVSERHLFTARDGEEVPISLVYHRDRYVKGKSPGYLYAYGSYGYSTDPYFQSKRLSLLDRGFVFAIIHVRGGMEMGRHWYEDGRLLNKKNTFNDFVDGSRFLVKEQFVAPDRVFAAGGSAGGLLMGVIANEAPEVYRGIIAKVPFVDVITTMQDESIPLTTGEYTEWGNPADKPYYDYMLSYSPYDQVSAQDYPHMLVTTGLHDSQVQYFEPVKWVSRLRRLKTDDNLLLIDIDMSTGHGGASGRYDRYRRDALEFAFILNVLGQAEDNIQWN